MDGSGTVDQATPRIALYGEFGTENLGNEGSLRVAIDQLRSRLPRAHLVAVCVHPDIVTKEHGIGAVSMHAPRLPEDRRLGRLMALLNRATRKLVDPLWGIHVLKGFDVVCVAGTGIVEDSGGLRAWQTPWALLAIVLAARARRVHVAFLNVGVSPPTSGAKKRIFRTALELACYRSYRDEFSRDSARGMGVDTAGDVVVPDICFALAAPDVPCERGDDGLVVGLGVMAYHGDERTPSARHLAAERYHAELTDFAVRLVDDGYRVRVLIGETTDIPVAESLAAGVRERAEHGNGRIEVHRAADLTELMAQMSTVDAVVATRFHNVVCSLLVGVPTVAIYYAPKCSALMDAVGQAEFRLDSSTLDSAALREKLDAALADGNAIRERIAATVSDYPRQIMEQFDALTLFLTGGGAEPRR